MVVTSVETSALASTSLEADGGSTGTTDALSLAVVCAATVLSPADNVVEGTSSMRSWKNCVVPFSHYSKSHRAHPVAQPCLLLAVLKSHCNNTHRRQL
jgi:hypothetical protein